MTYIGLKVQNVAFDGHITVRYLGEDKLDKIDLKELLTHLSPYENLRFNMNWGGKDYFGPKENIPVMRVFGLVYDVITERMLRMLDTTKFISQGYPPVPHVTLPNDNYPLPTTKKFIVGPLYISNAGTRTYLGA